MEEARSNQPHIDQERIRLNVTVVGDGGEYYVSVPAKLEPGQDGTVKAYGKWDSNHVVKVTAPEVVEVTNSETQAKTNVNVEFNGIESVGNDLEDMDVSAPITIDKGDIRFGTWTGRIVYNVEYKEMFKFKANDLYTPVRYESSILAEQLVAGETYVIEWDGIEYTCVAQEVTGNVGALDLEYCGIGNCQIMGGKFSDRSVTINGTASEEPFFISNDSSNTTTLRIYTRDTSATHSVKITQQTN